MLHISMLAAQFVERFKKEEGAGLAEYALLLFLIALASVTILGTLGGTIAQVFTDIDAGLNNPAN